MNTGLLLAAGKGKRFLGPDKLFAELLGKPVVYWSLKFLQDSTYVDEIFVAVNGTNKKRIEKLIKGENLTKVRKVFFGGQTRFESVMRGLRLLKEKIAPGDYLIIHNAANPLATHTELEHCLLVLHGRKSKKIFGVSPGRRISGTLKKVRANNIEKTLPREEIWEMETPQVVCAREFIFAASQLGKRHVDSTDDLAILEAGKFRTAVIPASMQNGKITAVEDVEFLEKMEGSGAQVFVGIGEDSHRFSPLKNAKQCLVLGGVKVKNMPKLEAESDGDVLLHSLCNAISGALGSGSLGTYATDMRKRGTKNSTQYLKHVTSLMERQRRKILHCSFSIEAREPKIDPLSPRIKKNLSRILKISPEKIGITATTGENLTPFGRGEAIRCQSIVTLCSSALTLK